MASLVDMVQLAQKQSDPRLLYFKRDQSEETWHINSWGDLDVDRDGGYSAFSADDLLAMDWSIAEPPPGCSEEVYSLYAALAPK